MSLLLAGDSAYIALLASLDKMTTRTLGVGERKSANELA